MALHLTISNKKNLQYFWAVSLSLTTTYKISIDLFSYGY